MIGTPRRSLMLVALAVALTVSACSGASSGSSGSTAAGTTGASQSAAAEVDATPETSAQPYVTPGPTFARTVTVSVTDRKVTPSPARIKVKVGDKVQILVTSDVANTIHVHGVDIEKDLPAGKQTAVDVTMTQVGIYEVEMHHPALLLFQFEVR